MSTIAFLNIAMHGRVNPTLPIVAELVRRGHTVTYHTSARFAPDVEAAGAKVFLYAGGEQPLPDPPTPVTLIDGLARTAVVVLPELLGDLRAARPDLIVHDSACLWGAVAAKVLGIPAVSSFTTFAFNREALSPTRLSRPLLREAASRPGNVIGYLRARTQLRRRYGVRGLPLVDLGNLRQPLNLVYTSSMFQPGTFDDSYRFVGPSIGSRPMDPTFPFDRLRNPVLYVSLGTVFKADPAVLRTFATALAPLGGTVIVATGQTDPAALGPVPANVVVRSSVPQPDILTRAALFVTHGGMNSANEAMYAGVPMLVVPQGADQPLVASRVVQLGAGLSITPAEVSEGVVRDHGRRLLHDPAFHTAAAALQLAEREPGGFRRAADELERYLGRTS
ncbi:oleandomycin glycosyltransferase [Kribbella sandramycini]|uniref:MGT family glycosyltransferase n=1 Tax=Kribbella sandramycini TaxID=60450 RepID=A0A7Y4KXD5_9ACTN|nr:macrolide family glycosyltransferase [Kribbella sandramycini]MBB6569765.1 MGT family glycosyltransferase [Kribbella sandramycini]NOL40408.1 oleandomycin glycosyltransferase [Kribbella sandramycini]